MLAQIKTNLLEKYQKYDYLNTNKKNPLVKIFVSYIKPSFLFKSEILTPIHLGREVAQEHSKDGIVTTNDLEWLYTNCIGDNDFAGNISSVNRKVGFFTGTYWAWKNYEKLGNPEYFGSFGYRRLLDANFLENLTDYDLIIPEAEQDSTSNKERFINAHGINLYKITLKAVEDLYGETAQEFEKYLMLNWGYYSELYIMKKDLFFEFCNWIYPILLKLLENRNYITIDNDEKEKIINYFNKNFIADICNRSNFENYQMRNLGFAMERLTGFFLYQKKNQQDCRVYEAEQIKLEDRGVKTLLATLRLRHNTTMAR